MKHCKMKTNKLISISLLACMLIAFGFKAKQQSIVIPAHSHNDYEHEHPLFDALNCNFKSIEADVYLRGDSLFVAHNSEDIKPGRTLRQLYLEPLKKRIMQNNGSVYGNGEEIILLVDIKDDGLKTYQILHKVLEDYRQILTSFENDEKKQGAVIVVISGNRPFDFMKSQTVRYAGFDGRLENLDSDISPNLMPMVSDNWGKHFTWNGNGEISPSEKNKLKLYAEKAKNKGYILRFWGTPNHTKQERKNVWTELQNAGVGLIGADNPEELKEFLLRK